MPSPYDYKLPNFLTEEDLKKIRRQKIWFGKMGIHEDTKEQLLSQRAREAGLGAIESIREQEQQPIAGEEMAKIGANLNLGKDVSDQEAMEKFTMSPGGAAHMDTLSQLPEKRPSYEEIVEEEVTSKGLGGLPEVKDFLSRREGAMGAEAASADAEKTKAMMIDYAKELGKDPKNHELALGIWAVANSGKDLSKYEDVLKATFEAGKDVALTEGNIKEKMTDIWGKKKTGEDKQEDTMEKARFDRETKIMIENLDHANRLAEIDLKGETTKGKADKNVKGLMDLSKAFDQLKSDHDKIWTGPVAGRAGRANITGPERAAFKSTRVYVLKTIARAFEGARMSDIDMTFYEKMIPQDSHTEDQFKSIQNSIMKLTEWRIKRFNEDGKDPGTQPTEGGAGTGVSDYTDEDETRYQELLRKQQKGTLQ